MKFYDIFQYELSNYVSEHIPFCIKDNLMVYIYCESSYAVFTETFTTNSTFMTHITSVEFEVSSQCASYKTCVITKKVFMKLFVSVNKLYVSCKIPLDDKLHVTSTIIILVEFFTRVILQV